MATKKIPLKIRFLIGAHKIVSNTFCHSNQTVNRSLLTLFDFTNTPDKIPRHGVSSSDTLIDVSRNLWIRLFTPPAGDQAGLRTVIVYFHGGGFTFFTPASFVYDNFCRRLVRELGVVVASVNYRRSPEYRYPIQYDDSFDALKFIDDNFDKCFPSGFADPKRCFLAGDSAGGNLAHHVAARASEHEFRNLKIKGMVAIQPFFGGEERTESEIRNGGSSSALPLKRTDWFWKAFLPEGTDRDHPAANVSGPNAVEISGMKFPDTLVIAGGLDPLLDWERKYMEWLKKGGKEVELVEYENMFHGFVVFEELTESCLALEKMKDFIQKR